MKQILALITLTLFSSTLFASHITCAGPNIFISSIYKDFGISPPPGTLRGTKLIVYKGEVLLKKQYFTGLGVFETEPFAVEYSGHEELLESVGNQNAGSNIYKETVSLFEVDTVNPSNKTFMAAERVVCSSSWAFLP